ncbi:MAG: glycosylase [Isosphaeraceae bacterium]|nr:glycosylase [Isosphaeraceae bacterium]
MITFLLATALLVPTSEPFPSDLTRWIPDGETPVFAGTGTGTWDAKIRERGWIMELGGVYHLWYTGYNDAISGNRFLGHAVSRDGRTWTRDPNNPLRRGSWVEDMCVVAHEGVLYMFAEGEKDRAHLLTSSDGSQWTERGPLDIRKVDGSPISEGPYGTPTAWFENGAWHLLYERGDRGVWLARSTDLRVWTNVQDDPVIPMGPAAYDREAVAVNQIFKRDGWYYVIYHANAQRPWKDWTTCIARSKDLIHWEKFSGNPIVAENCSSGILVSTPAGPRLYTMHPAVRVFRPAP